MQLRTLVESFSQFETGLTTAQKIEKGRAKLFDFDYPIFDPAYKKVFETHFIRNFYMREIGFETEGAFKFHLETWLIVNMPYFNKLFESELIEYDPLVNSKMESSHKKTTDKDRADTRTTTANSTTDETTADDTTSNSTENGFNRELQSDTPDTRLAITTNDGAGVIEYASKIEEDKSTNSSNATVGRDVTHNSTTNNDVDDNLNSEINETEDFIQQRLGKIGIQTFAKMIQEHRQAFIRVEKQMFDEMQPLFMMVY